MVGTRSLSSGAHSRDPVALPTLRTSNRHMLRDIKTARNALSEVPPMSARHRSALAAALWLVAAAVPALADDIMLPREPQIGPRPFYLDDKMKDGPLKQHLSQCTGQFRKTDFSI